MQLPAPGVRKKPWYRQGIVWLIIGILGWGVIFSLAFLIIAIAYQDESVDSRDGRPLEKRSWRDPSSMVLSPPPLPPFIPIK